MLSRFCVFPVRKQQVLLHLFSFLPEVAKHLVTNTNTSHPLLFAKWLANNHASGERHENRACNSFMENAVWSKMVPKLEISLLRKAAFLFLIFWKFPLNEKQSEQKFILYHNIWWHSWKNSYQNITGPTDDLWSSCTRPDGFLVIWDDRTTANVDPCFVFRYLCSELLWIISSMI